MNRAQARAAVLAAADKIQRDADIIRLAAGTFADAAVIPESVATRLALLAGAPIVTLSRLPDGTHEVRLSSTDTNATPLELGIRLDLSELGDYLPTRRTRTVERDDEGRIARIVDE